MAILKLYEGNNLVKTFKLDKPLLTLGRSKESDIPLETNIPALWAHILLKGNEYILKAIGRARLKVNQKMVVRHTLQPGDKIYINSFTLEFLLSEPKEEARNNFEVLWRVARRFNQLHSTREILNYIIDEALKITGGERGFIMLREAGELKTKVERNIELSGDERSKIISRTIINRVITEGVPVLISSTEAHQELAGIKSIIEANIKAILCVPLKEKDKETIGVIYLDRRFKPGIFKDEDIQLMVSFADFAALAIERGKLVEKEKKLLKEVTRLEEQAKYSLELEKLRREKEVLQSKIKEYRFEELIGCSPPMQRVFTLIDRIADTDVTVLIQGATGTGKELVARAIHTRSSRRDGPFIVVNCGAIPENLLEAELFGYEKGSFTGAVKQKKGKFELAQNGSIFLDEVGELPLSLQVKLLRVLQTKQIERLGGVKPLECDIRVIAATNKNLLEEKEAKRFREDLYYRLATVVIQLPLLKERGDDVVILANLFLNKFSQEFNKKIKGFTPEAKVLLLKHSWPGNVRELENKIRKAVLLAQGEYISGEELEFLESPQRLTLREARRLFERNFIKEVLIRNKRNLTQTAKELDIDRGTLRELIVRYDISKE
jgi:transcriptional regulator with GAF, ATPase, and Fis domain